MCTHGTLQCCLPVLEKASCTNGEVEEEKRERKEKKKRKRINRSGTLERFHSLPLKNNETTRTHHGHSPDCLVKNGRCSAQICAKVHKTGAQTVAHSLPFNCLWMWAKNARVAVFSTWAVSIETATEEKFGVPSHHVANMYPLPILEGLS